MPTQRNRVMSHTCSIIASIVGKPYASILPASNIVVHSTPSLKYTLAFFTHTNTHAHQHEKHNHSQKLGSALVVELINYIMT